MIPSHADTTHMRPLDRASARSSERDLRCLRATETICEDESSWTGAVEDRDSSYYSSSM